MKQKILYIIFLILIVSLIPRQNLILLSFEYPILVKMMISDKLFYITQTEDNSYYLDHDVYGNYNKLGNPFLDYRNSINDRKLLIYGHNSRYVPAPFHFLEKYLEYDFFEEHSQISLIDHLVQTDYNIFSVMIVKDGLDHIRLNFSKDEWLYHLDWIKTNSIYYKNIDLDDKSNILVLQTCYYEPSNSYLLIIAIKKEN